MDKIKFGWKQVSIVPENKKITLVGQFYERVSDEVETPICVTALAIESGLDHAIMVSCDLCSVSNTLLQKVREYLPDDCGFDKNKIILNAIHTHTSMGYEGRSDSTSFGGNVDVLKEFMAKDAKYVATADVSNSDVFRGEEAANFLVERIATAITQAWANRKEGLYASGFGRAAVGMCRRVCYDDGSAKMWGNVSQANFTELEGGNDSGIELLFTYDLDKKLTGVIANVACPAQVLEHQEFISSDYMGKLRDLIQAQYGAEVCLLGLISPAGDMCPRDLVRWVGSPVCKKDPNIPSDEAIERRADPCMYEIEGCKKVAKRIMNEINWALEDVTEFHAETDFVHKPMIFDMPLRRATIAEYEKAMKEITSYFEKHTGDINYADNARLQIYSSTVARFRVQQKVDMYPIEIHIMKLGDIAFATNPYELFLNYGNQIRARSLAKQTFLTQLCCGAYGYLPTEKAEKGGHYSAFIGGTNSDHVGGEMLVRKTLREINNLFKD